MRLKLSRSGLALFASLASLGLVAGTANAAFAPNRIIDDSVFNNVNSLSALQIDSFLNGFANSCISPNSGFRAVDPTGYNPTSGFQYGGFVSAGQVIYDSAQVYGINPQVLLTTLEKEQSLVTGRNNFAVYCNNGDQHKYAAAVGYGCPDSGTTYSYSGLSLYQRNGATITDTGTTCVNSATKAGFSQQVIRAAWLLKFGQQRSKGNVGWAVIKGNWNNSDDPQTCYGGPMTQGTWQRCPSGATTFYDGYTTIDGSPVHIDTGGTAALYWYTPHFSGNQNFQSIFTNWFGSTTASNSPYAWDISSAKAYTDSGRTAAYTNSPVIDATPGATVYVTLKAENTGYQSWPQNTVHLGTTYPRDRASTLSNGTWLSTKRVQMQETNVLPGSTGTFVFSLTAPSSPGTYVEHLSLVADGIAWMNDPDFYYTINVSTPITPTNNQHTGLVVGEYLSPGDRLMSPDSQTVLTLQSDGKVVVYVDHKPVWSNNVSNNNAQALVLQSDGNLVEYDGSGHALWSSVTNGAGAHLSLQTDGNVVLYNGSGGTLWSTGTSTIPSNHLAKTNYNIPPSGVMYPGQFLQTADRAYTLVLQASDGNLVEYDSAGRPVWSSGTSGTNNAAVMQTDGNMVIYGSNGKALWSTGTSGSGNTFTLQSSGRLVITSGNNTVAWSNNVVLRSGQFLQTADRAYTLVLQASDGNLVEYDSAGRPVWSSGTSGTGNALILQGDGNLVIYNRSGQALWSSRTGGFGNVMALQSDGNIVVYGGNGRVLWAAR